MITTRLIFSISAFAASAAVLQAAGVSVGSSTLIAALDYSDTFTQTAQGGINPNRPSTAAIQPAPAYIVENSYGNPSVSFNAAFSFASDTDGLVPGTPTYPGGSGAGSATGITQTGGGVDYGLPYGLRNRYTVQVDAVQVGDRIDISSGGGVGIFAANSLSVFFRGDGSGNASLFNGGLDVSIRSVIPTFTTNITGAGQWINYAASFDMSGKTIELFVNQVSLGVIDLTAFNGGTHANFSNAFVGAGAGLAGGENRTWTDNFQVGGTVPEPGSLMFALSTLGMAMLRRRR